MTQSIMMTIENWHTDPVLQGPLNLHALPQHQLDLLLQLGFRMQGSEDKVRPEIL